MLRFISRVFSKPIYTDCYFNTSHVTVYQHVASENHGRILNFNTSHVTVYHKHKVATYIVKYNFNTSHVTVYRPLQAHRFFHHTFQYIPCYGLSQCSALLRLLSAYFNTSHVTVYPMAKSLIHIIPTDFNTSHVTVYHYSVEICQAGRKISIHPMLRFI